MLLADLKAMAGGMGIAGANSMKKAQLIEAIKAAQAGAAPQPSAAPSTSSAPQAATGDGGTATKPRRSRAKAATAPAAEPHAEPAQDKAQDRAQDRAQVGAQELAQDRAQDSKPDRQQGERARQGSDQPARTRRQRGEQATAQSRPQQAKQDQAKQDQAKQDQAKQDQAKQESKQDQAAQQARQDQAKQESQSRVAQQAQQPQQGQDRGQQDQDHGQDGDGDSRRNRRRRGRDRDRNRRGELDTSILDDDVLVPAAGILDVLDNYAFVRTSGYLPGPDDVYVSLSLVKKLGLRSGDAIVGQVRQPRDGERREKFNPMVRIDAVNGADPETARHRADFTKLTPLHAEDRLRMETDAHDLLGRMIDLAAPVGKGQRGLIVSPAKAGKTAMLQRIAASVTANNPECHLMVVLVDERPEEVTDFERSVKGEVISSTFDRPAADHTALAELAIERAKRLVELGHDVVVLLDGITRLGRAYNLALPASGRVLSGGVDAAALHPPKKFFGAGRNVENGGSLTILATAVVESGSKVDELVFEEIAGTANMEIRLRREFADKRLFPAVDLLASGTRREDLLLGPEEVEIVWKLRKALANLEPEEAHERLLERLRATHSNVEFLTQVQHSTPGQQ
nr:transcription termination factor Rho [Nocardioides insulae]